MGKKEITIFHLHMTSPAQHLRKVQPAELVINEAKLKQAKVNRFLYKFIGESWYWLDKISWTDQQWIEYAEHENLRTWIAYTSGSIAGYYELQLQDEETVELKYFGLGPASIGKGFGGAMLSHAIDSAWRWGNETWGNTQRVWVNTCTLDHQHALTNYRSRGFTVFKEENVIDQ